MIPLVSIIMATYNRAHFIVETLASIQNQTYSNWECLIIDDGGTDDTGMVIQPFLIEDKRFQYIKRPNSYKKGLPGCRNYGLDIATGMYIIFFDDDDIVHPKNLEICIDEFLKEEIDYCRYLRDVFHEQFHYNFDLSNVYNKFFIESTDIDKLLDHRLPFNSCSVMWKKECFKNNRFVETLMYAEEWELYSKILSNGAYGVSINKVLFYGRKHSNSNTGEFYLNNAIRLSSYKEAIKLVTKNLSDKGLLSDYLLKYLVSIAIGYRDTNLVNYILLQTKINTSKKIHLQLKNFLYPIWKEYKLLIKKIK